MDPKYADDQAEPNTVIDDEIGSVPLDDEDDLPVDDDADDEAETEDDEAEESTDTAAAPQGDEGKSVSRRTIRVQKIEKERDSERARAAELQNRLNEILTAQRQPQDDAARRAEEARVAQMDPLERKEYEQQKKIDALESQVANLGFAQQDGLDRARFEAKAEINPVYKKYAEAVESTLQEMRAKNVNTTREALLTYKLGEAQRKKLEAGEGEGRRRREAAQARVSKANGRPANLRGDNSGSSRGKTEEDRLRGIQI